MRSMECFIGREDEPAHALSRRRLKKNLENDRSVGDDQWLFLSARTAAAGAGRGRTG